MMHLLKPKERYVEIEPGSMPVEQKHADKVRAAIAKLGEKWCLAKTRKEQIEQLKAEGADLV